MGRQKERMSLEDAFMVDNTVSLTYCLEKKNSWREVSYLGESHKFLKSGAIPERSNHVLDFKFTRSSVVERLAVDRAERLEL